MVVTEVLSGIGMWQWPGCFPAEKQPLKPNLIIVVLQRYSSLWSVRYENTSQFLFILR